MEPMTLHVDDWTDEGTLYQLVGRGAPVATYCVHTIRRAIDARMTERERIDAGATFPEYAVRRVIADHPTAAPGDCDHVSEPRLRFEPYAVEAA